ncbi:unnamed protein product [Rhodiola kirilowii]
METKTGSDVKRRFWKWAVASMLVRLVLIYYSKSLNLAARPELSTPVTSLRRLAEGYWLKQASISPYSGSMYHGSPLLLSIFGPLTVESVKGLPGYLLCSLLFVVADMLAALLLRETGRQIKSSHQRNLELLGLDKMLPSSEILYPGDIAALLYLWNPMTILTCVSYSTTPIENLIVILTLYGASAKLVPLAALGWVMASHLSLYPSVLIIPVILLLGYGSDAPPRKLFQQKLSCAKNESANPAAFSWKSVMHLFVWVCAWSFYILILCGFFVRKHGSLLDLIRRTYGFILTVEDLSPNIGVQWYFFAEVFDYFRNFFLMVFHMNVVFMILPLAIRLNHRPCFLAFVYITIYSMLKSYPSVGDSALYIGLLGLFINELADMKFSFFLLCGYIGVNLLSPVMHNLWIWRGTGNANFYFATAMAYACFQIILVVETVNSMLHHDRKLKRLLTTEKEISSMNDGNSASVPES